MITGGRRAEIESAFEEALDVPRAERAAWVDARLGGDPELQREVRALLAAHDRAEGVLESGVGRVARRISSGLFVDPMRDRRIGPYKVLKEIGRGGMGVVYLAERDDGQFRRRVAVKLLHASPDAGELQRRFLAERQILASLSHPNIALLIDGGVTDGQLPYIAMEHVDGDPITVYCDQHRLGLAARLKLFQEVCAAVHHAHQNLVVHRDLKPSNILVTKEGQVKLLDFGIAKLLNPTLGAAQPVTRTSFRVMTPEYASPEQVQGTTLTTASDVYALGVVLYELLAGRRPYHLASGSPKELQHLVVEREPDKPSSRVVRAETVASVDGPSREIDPVEVAARRGLTPERLCRRLQGDLDDIVMMALRKEPRRRYGSAELLGQDIGRWLDGLPVQAHGVSHWYRAKKLMRRHRVATAAGALAVLSLAVGTGVALWQTGVARAERDRAERALSQSEEVTAFLMRLVEAGDPDNATTGALSSRDVLEQGARRVEELAAQPLVQARLLEAMGRVNKNLVHYPEARTQLERAIALRERAQGRGHPDVARTRSDLAELLRRTGKVPEARAMADEALRIRQAALAPDHPDVALSLQQVAMLALYFLEAPRAERLQEQALAILEKRYGPDSPELPNLLLDYATTQSRLGRADSGEAAIRRALQIRRRHFGPDDVRTIDIVKRLGDYTFDVVHDESRGEAYYRQALGAYRRILGPEHPRSFYALDGLAWTVGKRGRFDEADSLFREATAIALRTYGEGSWAHAAVRQGQGEIYQFGGRFHEAETAFRESIVMNNRIVGPDAVAQSGLHASLADVLANSGRFAAADSAMRRAITIRKTLVADAPMIGRLVRDLGGILVAQKRFAEADSAYHEALRIFRKRSGEGSPEVRRTYDAMARLYGAWGKPSEAAEYRRMGGQ